MADKKTHIHYAWGPQGREKKLRIRKDSFAVQILKGIAITGLVAVAATSPYFGFNLVKGLIREYDKRQWRKARKSLWYLKSRGYVRILSESPDGMKVEITRAGERVVKHVDVTELKLPSPAMWDRKWRVIVFDVPNWKSKNRAAFRERIKELGFRLVQKSVWVYPHECREQVMILRKFYDIEQYVTYLETTHSGDEDAWLRIFRMEDKKS